MPKPVIIITGKNGQLGWELEQLAQSMEDIATLVFVDQAELDLSQPASVAPFFAKHRPAYFIHCGAYTAVDKAETEQELAYTINAAATGAIAEQCKSYGTKLIAISTDYVFDGNGTSPYLPSHKVDPVNYYGYSKAAGEKLAMDNHPETVIIRTSWVYSTHANNFVKTMIRLMKERPEIKVVNDQVGSPTYAADLAAAIWQIVRQWEEGNTHYGIYHYSNTGIISWFDFATAIRNEAGLTANVLPIPGSAYPTPAKRPAYSAMDTTSIVQDFGVTLVPWQESLHRCVTLLSL